MRQKEYLFDKQLKHCISHDFRFILFSIFFVPTIFLAHSAQYYFVNEILFWGLFLVVLTSQLAHYMIVLRITEHHRKKGRVKDERYVHEPRAMIIWRKINFWLLISIMIISAIVVWFPGFYERIVTLII